MTDELLASVADGEGSTIVHVDDVAETAAALVEHLEADLVEGAAGFVEAVAQRREALAERAAARTALVLTAIRSAAADVIDARTAVAACEREVERLTTTGGPDGQSSAQKGDVAPSDLNRRGALRITDRDEVTKAVLRTIAALAVAVLVLILTGSPLALVLPAVAVCWGVVVVVRQRDSAYDSAIASRNLQNMARLTDRAYGGAGLPDSSGSLGDRTEQGRADRALVAARERLAHAEASWRALAGAEADVDDVESVVQDREARYGLGDADVSERPSSRTLTDEERSRFEARSAGRSEDELRTVASQRFPVVVVADGDATIDEDRLRGETAQLPADVRFVVVAPTG